MSTSLKAWSPVHKWTDADYVSTLTNTSSSATMAFSSVASDKADWKAKLFVETGAKLKAGKVYSIRYRIKADKAFKYNLFYNNGAEEKAVGDYYELKAGTLRTVEHEVSPEKDAELVMQFMLGTTNAPNKVTISDVKVEEIVGARASGSYPVNYWAHEDYKVKASNTKKSATLTVTKAPRTGREAWKVKLFAETGAKLKAGKTYRVTVGVKANKALTYDICYNNGGAEAELGAKYGLAATKAKKIIRYNVTPKENSDLIVQLGLGNAVKKTDVTISDIKVEEVLYTSAKTTIPKYRYDSVGYFSRGSDPGYLTSLDQNASSATFRIKHAPATDRHAWSAKVVVRTGITPKPGKGYRINFNVDAAKEQNLFEVFYDGNEELAYGALYEQHLSAGRNPFSYTIMPGDNKGEIVLQLRFGETNGTDGNAYDISGFTVEEVTFVQQRRPEIKDATELALQDGYTATLKRAADSATVQIVDTPAEEELEAWKNKLFCYTGVVFEPGEKYRVTMNVKSIIPAPFEVCFNKGDEEKGIGGIFGLMSQPYGEYVEFTTYAKEEAALVVQLSLGNCVAPNTVFFRDIKVEKAGKIDLVSDTIYTF